MKNNSEKLQENERAFGMPERKRASVSGVENYAQMSSSFQKEVKYKAESATISSAVIGKNVVMDKETGRIYGITENGTIEFNERLMKGLTITAQNILKNFKQELKNGNLEVLKIINALTYIECTNAAFVDTPEFRAAKKELNNILAEMINSQNQDERVLAKEGILGFFVCSRNNIVEGKKFIEGANLYLDNSEEKEFLRAMFIAEMFEDKVFDFEFLELSGEFDTIRDMYTIDATYKDSKFITPDQLVKIITLSKLLSSREEILEYYFEKDTRYFFDLANSEEVAKYLIEGRITPRDAIKKIRIKDIENFSPDLLEELLVVPNFPKGTEFINYTSKGSRTERYLNKKFLNNLDREQFLRVVLSEKIAENYKNPYTSIDYIDEYGKLNSDDIILLEQVGKVNEEDVIKISKFESMKIQNPEEYNKMLESLLEFYDFERLKNMANLAKLNPKFVELYNNVIENLITEEQRKVYFEKMNKALENSENQDEIVTSFFQLGLKIGKDINYEISEEYISEQYLEDAITEQELIELYEQKLISIEAIRNLYSDSELVEKYRNGDLDYKVLNLLKSKVDIIKQELEAQRLEENQLIDLYSKTDGLTVEEFLEITENYNFQAVNLVDYISDEITPEKINGLFTNYYISQDDLSILVARKLITKEEAKAFADKMANHAEYESIFALDNRIITLTSETEGGNGGGGYHHGGYGPVKPQKLKNDPELQELLLSQLGFDERTLTLRGTNNSLDGYRVYPSEDYGVMVFLKNDKPGNATYIMSLQQGLYFLNKIVREKKNREGETEERVELQSDATKAELRETEYVKVRNAAAGWGSNIVDAMKSLSPKFKEKLRTPSEYRCNIDAIVEEIKEDYIYRKNNPDVDAR